MDAGKLPSSSPWSGAASGASSRSLGRLLNPLRLTVSLWAHRQLIREFTRREVLGRYRGASLGVLWSFLTPLMMLAVYAFVFRVVFNARWGIKAEESRGGFAMTMFCGMCVYQVFSECLTRAPSLIVGNVNYVKKVVFPLEILPVAVLGSALIHLAVSMVLLIVAVAIAYGTVCPPLACLPIVLLPVALISLGLSWLLASLGVYIRDVGHAIGVVVQILFFMTPVFYPISAVPDAFQFWMRLNPLTDVVEQARRVVIYQQFPDWQAVGIGIIIGAVICQLGYAWFMKTKRGFADVV
jgi:lipopolysaccharide transport system permease protein